MPIFNCYKDAISSQPIHIYEKENERFLTFYLEYQTSLTFKKGWLSF